MIERLVLLLVLCFSACVTGPSPADVAADRARWTAVRDVTLDGQVDGPEAAALTELLIAWDEKLRGQEAAAGSSWTPEAILADMLRVYGPAAVQVFLGPKLEAQAPELYRLVDRNADHVLSAEEMLAIDPRSPVFAVVVLSTLQQLLGRRHGQ